jgi:RNA polymerase primary sigma factor
MSVEDLHKFDLASSALLNRPEVELLGCDEERNVLLELGECRKLLLEAHRRAIPVRSLTEQDGLDIQDVVRDLLKPSAMRTGDGLQLDALVLRYTELRTKLAMANLRLVAHVAKRYRNRGLAPSDLLQDGFCGLLKAIDRFDATKETRLASYAVWWIRQAIQRAVAAGAYPVRLNPRHLQQLANSNPELPQPRKPGRRPRSNGATSTIRQIHSATRPTISLNSNPRDDDGSSLLNALTYPPQEEAPSGELDEYLVSMIQQLKPREQLVLQLRYGLGGRECHSLSQVSAVLDVSKERIRQIQEAALRKLRNLAQQKVYCEATG